MASQGSGRRQPRRVLPELPLSWSFGRQPDGEAPRRGGGGVVVVPRLFGDRFNEAERLRVVLLGPSPLLLALEEPGFGSTGPPPPPLFLGGRGSWHQLALDVAGFSAEELTVTLEGRQLTVLGKQETEAAGADGSVCRERRQLRQELLLPPDADLEALTCALGHDGQLRLRAPRLERIIPVTVERSPSEAGGTDGGAEAEAVAPAGGEKVDGADEQ